MGIKNLLKKHEGVDSPKKPYVHKKPVALSLYFGIPGAGKSTFAAYLAKKDMAKGRKVWSNFGITSAGNTEIQGQGNRLFVDIRLFG